MDKRRQAEHQTDRFLDSSITRHINCQTDGFKTDGFKTGGFKTDGFKTDGFLTRDGLPA